MSTRSDRHRDTRAAASATAHASVDGACRASPPRFAATFTRAWWRTTLVVCALVVVNLGSTDLMPRALYDAYYVTLLLKTVPLIPVWLAMQGELLGLIPIGLRSQTGEADARDVTAGEALPHRI